MEETEYSDYADQRFYASTYGRMSTPDPYDGSANPSNPPSWNRYSYAGDDPINLYDPTGLDSFTPFQFPCTVGAGEYADRTTCELYTINKPPGPLTIADYDDFHGIAPPCPPVPRAPSGLNANQIQQNVEAAQNFLDAQVNSGQSDPLLALAGYLSAQFAPGGAWDYKKDYVPGTTDQAQARIFGNFDFGAVLESLGFSYYATQNAAGVEQIGIALPQLRPFRRETRGPAGRAPRSKVTRWP
jgi:RHS repeat-associated protein